MMYAPYLQYGWIRKSVRKISKMRAWKYISMKSSFTLAVREWDVNCKPRSGLHTTEKQHTRTHAHAHTHTHTGQAGEGPWYRRDKMVRTIISAPGGNSTKILASFCHGVVTILRYVSTIQINPYDMQVTEKKNTDWIPQQLHADGMPTCSRLHATQ